jgi:adenosylcobyric acid synthase
VAAGGPFGRGLRGGLLVCGTTSDAGKSFVVAGLCRLLARLGVRVAPFKAQNMALNAQVTAEGAEIGHAQWVQAIAAGVEPEAAMNPVLLKPTSDRASQVVVMGRPTGVQTAAEYHGTKRALLPVVLDALADLRRRFDVVICEGAGSPAEINLLDGDIVNLPLARAAGLPVIVVGDIDRGGVFASLYGTVALLPDDLRACVRGFVINKLRGDPALLGDGCAELEARCGVPTLGVLPMADGRHATRADDNDDSDAGDKGDDGDDGGAIVDIDNEDSLALDRVDPEPPAAGDTSPGATDVLDVAAIRWPRVANAGDLDPLRLEPGVRVRWVRSIAELGRPDLVVLPGSKNTRGDLAWFRAAGLAEAVERADAAIVAVCAGLQMVGDRIDDPDGVEGPPGTDKGLGWLPVTTRFRGDKVLDRPSGTAASGPGSGHPVTGYRIHHGRVAPNGGADTWLATGDGCPLGWHAGAVAGTTLHGLFEADAFRAGVLSWAASRRTKHWRPGDLDFAATRLHRLDRIADLLAAHLDLDRIADLITEARP